MNVRVHHLLCMRYFRGKGYSKEFVSNFYNVIRRLKKNPIVTVINYPDIICGSCPHNRDGKCIKKGPNSERNVRRKDDIVIGHLGIGLNQRIRFKDISNLVGLKLDRIRKICKRCEWRSYCKEGEAK